MTMQAIDKNSNNTTTLKAIGPFEMNLIKNTLRYGSRERMSKASGIPTSTFNNTLREVRNSYPEKIIEACLDEIRQTKKNIEQLENLGVV